MADPIKNYFLKIFYDKKIKFKKKNSLNILVLQWTKI